jgi:hypothetical protein
MHKHPPRSLSRLPSSEPVARAESTMQADENIFENEISDAVIEASASGAMITLPFSIDLFMCRFC